MTISFKRFTENVLLFTLLVCFLSFSACKADVDQTENIVDDSRYATVYIELNTPALENYGSVFSERTATPVLPNTITYSITASGTGSLPTGYNNSNDYSTFSAEKKYMLKLPAGTWTVTVTGKNSSSQTILSGTSEQFTVAADGEYHESVSVYFITDGTGKGRLKLEIETTGTNISYVKISGTGQTTYFDKQFNIETVGSKKIIKLYNSDSNTIPSGDYHPTLTFCNSDGSIATVIKETINIRNNMPTDTWYKSGNIRTYYLQNKEGADDGKADFILTQEIIDSLESNIFYVETGGSDSNDGTRLAPYATLTAALKRVNNLNTVNYDANASDSSGHPRKSFTIICDGEIGNTTTNITISPDHDLNLTIYTNLNAAQPATLKAAEFRLDSTSSNITFKNINLTGNIALDNGNLTMDSVPTTGLLDYTGGQLTLGGTTSISAGISLKAASKKILLDSAITSTAATTISADSSVVSSYTASSVILEGNSDVTSSDLSKFTWSPSSYTLVLKTRDGKEKAVLQPN